MENIKQKIADLIEDGVNAQTVEEHYDVANKLSDAATELHKLRECTITWPKGIKAEYAEAIDEAFASLLFEISELSDLCSAKENYFIACAVEVEDVA